VESETHYDAFAVAAPGLESIVMAELKSLRATRARTVEGGVEFRASRALLYAANLHVRTASRMLIRLANFHSSSFAELERRARNVPWETIVSPTTRVKLRVTCHKSRLYHSDAVAERVLDAIAVRANASTGSKTRQSAGPLTVPDDDEAASAQLFVVRLDHDECTISADASGVNLHQRGYRRAVTQAPLRETLAAAMVLASRWDGSTRLVDPFCGSGTIPIEAAMIARRLAPGRARRFRFMDWPDYDGQLWNAVLTRAREQELPRAAAPIAGTDRSGWAMRAAKSNADRAGVADDVGFEPQDATQLEVPPGPPGWIVTNPPYGVRLGKRDELRALYTRFGTVLRTHFSNWHVGVLSTDRRLDAQVRVPLLERFTTSNGGIRVHFLVGLVARATLDQEERRTSSVARMKPRLKPLPDQRSGPRLERRSRHRRDD
jgi:putative N6-adenine-specific DNA methylase